MKCANCGGEQHTLHRRRPDGKPSHEAEWMCLTEFRAKVARLEDEREKVKLFECEVGPDGTAWVTGTAKLQRIITNAKELADAVRADTQRYPISVRTADALVALGKSLEGVK